MKNIANHIQIAGNIKKVHIYLYGVFFTFILFLFSSPRPRGFRVNRKKRVIYWQTIFGSHAIAFVPEQGDPLGGINYSRFGLYAFGGHERFSLQLWIDDYLSKRRVTALFGVYPSPSSEHNAQILRAIRAYLTEDNPEFLKYVGRDFKKLWLKNLTLRCVTLLHCAYRLAAKKPTEPLTQRLPNGIRKPQIKNKAGSMNAVRHRKLSMNAILREELDNEVK